MSEQSMRLNMIMGLVDKFTAPVKKVTSTTEKMGNKIKGTQKELDRLGRSTKDIEHFRKLKAVTKGTENSFKQAQDRVKSLGGAMRASGEPTKKMTREFENARKELKRLEQQQTREREELGQLRNRMSQAGVSTRNLGEAQRRLREQTEQQTAQLRRQRAELNRVTESQQRFTRISQRNQGMRAGAMGDTVGVAAAVYGVKKLVDAYGDVSSAQGEIKSLGIDEEGIKKITEMGKAFSNQWSGTTQSEFIRASYDIKSGISSLSDEAVAQFTRVAALTGGATKSSTSQMTSLFATGYGIYRKQFDKFGNSTIEGWEKLSAAERDMKFGEYFSAGIASSVQAFKTDGSQMSSAISALGAEATSANVPFAEQLSILGMLQATMSGSEAGTKYVAFLGSAAKAGESLGLTFLDANNQLLSMPDILTELRKKYGDTIDAVEEKQLKKAFGTKEAVAMIKLLYPEIDTLKSNMMGMNESLQGGMAKTMTMAEAILLGPSESFNRLSNRSINAAAAIGQVFSPAMVAVADILGSTAIAVADFTEKFPVLTAYIGYLVTALVAFKAISILSRFAFSYFSDALNIGRKAFDFLRASTVRANIALVAHKVKTVATTAATVAMGAAQKVVRGSMLLMTGAQWALNAALSANPIGLVIVAIGALVAIVAVIIQHWEPLGAFFTGLWQSITELFNAAMDGIKNALGFDPLAFMKIIWDAVPVFFTAHWELVKGIFSLGAEGITALLSMNPVEVVSTAWNALPEFFTSLWAGMKETALDAMNFLIDKVMGPISALKDSIGGLWDSVFGDDEKVVKITKKVQEISETVPRKSSDSGGIDSSSAGRSVRVVGASISAAPVSNSVSYTIGDIHVSSPPGVSARDVAIEVKKQLESMMRAAQQKARGQLHD